MVGDLETVEEKEEITEPDETEESPSKETLIRSAMEEVIKKGG